MRFQIPLLGLLLGLALPAWGGELDRSFAVASGGKLIIALDFGSVDVERHEGDQIHIEARSRGVGASSVHFATRTEGRDVYFAGDAEPWVRWLNSAPGVRVRARVPEGVQVRVDAPSRVDVSGADVPTMAP